MGAVEAGRRLGIIIEEVANNAIARISAAPEGAISIDLLSTWAGISPGEVEVLRRIANETGGSDPTQVRTPPSSDLPTQKIDPLAVPSTSAPSTALPSRPNLPRKLGPYLLAEELGHGGMGIVFRARHEKLDSACAVKVLIAGEHASPEAIVRFQREAAAVAKMGKHPNIVGVHDLGQEGSLFYYAMELVDGRSLAARLREEEVSLEDSVVLMEKVARAIEHAHRNGIIHRDLKPENIVVRRDGEPQVMDFGLARELGTELRISVTGQVMGTPAYMAPEQVRGDTDAMDARTDVYGLGGVLYELLTRLPPHPGRSPAVVLPAILRGDVVQPRRLRPEIPKDIENICLKALAPERAGRYPTAEAFADDLARFRLGEPVHARPVGPMTRMARRVRRHPLVSTLLAGLTALALLLAWRYAGPARIRIEAEPREAKVSYKGRTMWGGGWVWPAGQFEVEVSAPGYETRTVAVDLPAGASRSLGTVKLDPDHGYLILDSNPPGAEVWLATRGDLGVKTPVAGLPIPNGENAITLKLDQHDDSALRVLIRPGATWDAGKVSLSHRRGTLRLSGSPPGLAVRVLRAGDHKEVTRLSAPVTTPLDSGSYVLHGHMNGSFDREVAVEVCAGAETIAHLPLDPQVRWKTHLPANATTALAVADLDDDGVSDCIVGCGDAYVRALSGSDGSELWTWYVGWLPTERILVGDLEGRGVPDCVGRTEGESVFALSGKDGSLLWRRKIGASELAADLTDLDGDGQPDIVVGTETGHVCALRGTDGTTIWEKDPHGLMFSIDPVILGPDASGGVSVVVVSADRSLHALSGRDGSERWVQPAQGAIDVRAVPDLDGDGDPDLLVCDQSTGVSALSGGDGREIWHAEARVYSQHGLTTADLDGDRVPEVIVTTSDSLAVALSGKDGKPLWRSPLRSEKTSSLSVGDMDGDGIPDCVVTGWDGNVHALSGVDGHVLWKYEAGVPIQREAEIADLDGDGVPECVLADDARDLVALDARGGSLLWSFQEGHATRSLLGMNAHRPEDSRCLVAFEDGRVCSLNAMNGTPAWQVSLPGPLDASVTWADLDDDGVTDVVACCRTGNVIALSGSDGRELWRGTVSSPWPAAVIRSGRGQAPDLLFASDTGAIESLSGRTGRAALLWPGGGFRQQDGMEPPDPFGGELAVGPVAVDVGGRGACIVGTKDGYAVGIADSGILWKKKIGDAFMNPIQAACSLGGGARGATQWVAITREGLLRVLDAATGQVVAQMYAGSPTATPARGDLDLNGDVELVYGNSNHEVEAHPVAGEQRLWTHATGSEVEMTPSVIDLDGSGAPQVLAGTTGGALEVLAGLDGHPLGGFQAAGPIHARATALDLRGDGMLDIIVGDDTGGVYAVSIARGAKGAFLPSAGRARRVKSWLLMAQAAKRVLESGGDAAARRIAWRDLGVASVWLKQEEQALHAFEEARRGGLRAADAAVYQWLAAGRWKGSTDERRERARAAIAEALRTQAEETFDALEEVWWLVGEEGRGQLREVLEGELAREGMHATTVVLLSLIEATATRPGAGVALDRMQAAEKELLARIPTAGRSVARWYGYLAILAHSRRVPARNGAREEDDFDRAYAAYRDLSRRPASLDRLLWWLSGK